MMQLNLTNTERLRQRDANTRTGQRNIPTETETHRQKQVDRDTETMRNIYRNKSRQKDERGRVNGLPST